VTGARPYSGEEIAAMRATDAKLMEAIRLDEADGLNLIPAAAKVAWRRDARWLATLDAQQRVVDAARAYVERPTARNVSLLSAVVRALVEHPAQPQGESRSV